VVDRVGSCFGGDSDFFAEERLEWFGKLAADMVGVVDVDFLEDGLV